MAYEKSQKIPISSPRLASPIKLGLVLSGAPTPTSGSGCTAAAPARFAAAAATARVGAGPKRSGRRGTRLRFGRIVVSEIEVPNMLANLV